MPRAIRLYVRYVEMVSRFVGRIAMYGIFGMIGLLLFSSLTKYSDAPPIWTLEVAQFFMVAYFLLGGGYSMQLDSHVRMDLVYGMWSPRWKGFADSITSFCLVFYLVLLLWGGYSSTEYAIQYKETSYSSWSPYMAPIKIIMVFGVVIMLLQSFATLFRDIARFRGKALDGELGDEERAT